MFRREPFRLTPTVGAEHMRSFRIEAPTHTHWRKASCAEAQCPHYLHGWWSEFDESTELGQFQASYVRTQSGRGFRESRTEAGMTRFEFHPGQTCFRSDDHHIRDEDIPELYVVRDGDWRGNPRHTAPMRLSPDGWVNEFGENQERVRRIKEGA